MSTSSEKALEALGHVQNELSVHSSASRAILTHLCQRLARLEAAVTSLQYEVPRLRSDAQLDTEGVRADVSGVQAKVESMSTQLSEYASVMDLFQSEMSNHKSSLSWLSSSLTNEHGRVTDVYEKVDNQRDDFNTRFSELSLKLEEIPRSVVALLAPSTREAGFTFRSADDKLSLQNHLRRLDGYSRGGDGGPYTDLQPFTIPDDMKAKVEMRIRQRELRKEEADALATAELAEAYRRLQLVSNPRLSEVRIQVDECQEQIQRAFQMIRDSNLHLYSYCESKAEKLDFAAVQSELKALRSRVRGVEISGSHRARHPPAPSISFLKQQIQPSGTDSLAISTVKDRSLPASCSPSQVMQLTAGQIPELRVSLLELSRNFNVLKLRWKKQHRQKGLNPVVKTHMEKVVAMINDAYSATAEEPVDLAAAARHVERVSRVLASDFSMQILGTMGCRNPQDDLLRRSVAANEIVPALCQYSELFTEYLRSDAYTGGSNLQAVLPAADPASLSVSSSRHQHEEQQHNFDRINAELEELVHNQRKLEATLAVLVNTTAIDSNASSAADARHVSDDLQQLREEIAAMRRHFVSEDTLSEVLRQLELRKSDREWSSASGGGGGVVGHRYPTNLSKRHSSASAGSLLDATSSADPLDPLDRPKSQAKLDPLQIHKMSGEARPGRAQQQHSSASGPLHSVNSPTTLTSNGGTVLSGRATALSKLQARSQMLRPRSSAQQPAADHR
ncbi:hypothetical protein PybrP1_006566 [[Pythium] brassicae (nom. inval.)]|nr:hypothetical protein PybrP1_006566 [[Pythium] brassicae (nom. inval.)]